jgi:PAS domain S-box-containing protein
MSAKADKRPPLRLTVDREATAEAATARAAEGAAEGAAECDPVADLARALLDGGAATCVTDRRGELIYANAAYERIAEAVANAGLAPIGRPIDGPPGPGDETVSPRDAAEASNARAERKHAVAVDGGTEYYSLRHEVLRDADGRAIARASIFTPITDRESAKTKLAAANERLEDITRLVSDWVWEINRNQVLTFVSPRVNEALGYHQLELTGRRLSELLAEPSDTVDALAGNDGRRPFRDLEVKIADRDGKLRHVLLSGLPVYCPATGSFLGFRGTAQDVSELKWREEALLRAKEEAELANRTKSEFLASMSHELRTPLNAIIGFSDIMGNQMLGPLGNAQYEGYTKDISDSARHLLALINDILDAAKIEAGQMSLAEEIINPHGLIESVRRLVAPRAERANLSLQIRVPDSIPALRADKTKLKQILINLISNALKFTPEGGRIELVAEAAPSGEFVFIVSDTGIGIAAEDIPRAMAPFGQVDSRLSRKFEGTGLGLPLAKSLTELHGGEFLLVSEIDVGTTVTVRLPATRIVVE